MRASRSLAAVLGLGLLVTLAPTAGATPSDSASPASGTIPGRYIVTLVDDADAGAVAREYRARGADVDHVYRAALNGFAGAIPANEIDRLRADSRVELVEADGWAHATDLMSQSNATWGLDRVDERERQLNKTYTYETTASNVTAYVLDTGIRAAHVDFGARVSGGFTAIDDGWGTGDCNGHGTHVAGTIGGATWGVAKAVTLVPVRVLNCKGSGTWSGVIAGVDWVTANAVKPAVANMSLGGSSNSSLDAAVRTSIDAGIVYALAAGNNSGSDACDRSPAGVVEGLTVGATTSTDDRASYSNIGTCLDLFAPGSSITSAWIDSDSDTHTISGTSMATPHVAGAAALWMSAEWTSTTSVATVNDAVVRNATPGLVKNEGEGSPDLLLHSLFGLTETAPATPADFQGKAVSSTQIDLRWSDVSNETSYALAVVVDGNRAVLASALPAGTTSYPHGGLTEGETYSYELTATNDAGTSSPATTSVTIAVPGTPSDLTATPVSSSAIDLAWTDVAGEDTYVLTLPDGTTTVELAAGTTSYSHTGLTASTTYTYSLKAVNAVGGSASVTVSARTLDAAAISLSATGYKIKGGWQRVDLSWSGAASTDVDVYRDGTVVATTANDGAHTDDPRKKGGGSYTYKMCEAGTTTCSADVVVTF